MGYQAARIFVIPNCTDIERYASPGEGAQEFDGLPIKNNLILYIGHFWDTKGVLDLLNAFLIVVKSKPELNLALAWSGLGNVNKVNNFVRDNNLENKVILLGQIKVQNLLARA